MTMSRTPELDPIERLSPAEKRAMLARLMRERGRPRSGSTCVHQRVEAQARQRPDAVAVADDDGNMLTYAELDRRANGLAHLLRTQGVGPESLVGLCLDRSPGMVAALLAVLKAGAAYLPLDPAYPAERLALMLDDARPTTILTQASLLDRIPDAAPAMVLDDPDWTWPESDDAPSGVTISAASLAYIIYTSGSTGRPKGVQVSHGALVNFLDSMRKEPGISDTDALLAVTTLSFDIAGLELWLPLICGARVELASRDLASDGPRLAEAIANRGITVMQATPATWRLLLSSGWPGQPGLKILCGGEGMPRDLADKLLGCGSELWNLYGPTETTIWSTIWKVEPGNGPISIGRPIANTQVYVLDPWFEPVPVGMAGELYIGGSGLARGYSKRPELTASRFVPDPFGPNPGGRLYRTGDLARWLPDGTLECLGRVDHQVKIRGYRIELSEVEAALRKHPVVGEAVVVAREDSPGDRRLVAYVTRYKAATNGAVHHNGNGHANANGNGHHDGDAATLLDLGSTLRYYLKGCLPEYMVPSAFVCLDSLPLTPNGKVDRRALPRPEEHRALRDTYEAPRTVAEEEVAKIWAEVLVRDSVGVRDDFFELGGHSLLATQVVSRIRERFGVTMPVRLLFEAPTVAALVERLEEARRSGQGGDSAPIPHIPRNGDLPLSYSQQALWFLDQYSPGEATFNVTSAVRIIGPLDVEAFGWSFAQIVRRHEALRTTFAQVDGRPVQVIRDDLTIPLDVLDLSGLEPAERERELQRHATDEARQPFDLECGPLARCRLIVLRESEHALLLTMHHIITDGWSFWIAAREIAVHYEAFRQGDARPLSELPIQYADYAAWQRGQLQGPALEKLLGYWTKQLAGVPPLELPTDHPRPPLRTSHGAIRLFGLEPALARSVEALCRAEGLTPFMLYLAAFQTLLHRYSGQDDLAVGSPIANRNRPETEGLIGYFVNMLALRTDLSGDPTFRELLRRIRPMALSAYEHQDLPLEILIETLDPERDPSRTPLFQVMFALQNNRLPEIDRDELEIVPIDTPEGTGTAKFDLTLALEDALNGGLMGSLEYNTDLFEASTIERMVGHLRTLLEAVVRAPDTRLSRLPMLTTDERHRTLEVWNQADDLAAPSEARVIHELFERQAERSPDAVAIVAGEAWITYGELNAKANKVAHHLRSLGVEAEMKVGLCVLDPIRRMIGLLGILKAGGAYVPLDPSMPPKRLATILDDAAVPVLLAEEAAGPFEHEAKLVRLDADWSSIEACSRENPSADVSPDNLAYVIYTSGSTGQPKGVLVQHAGLVDAYHGWESAYGLRSDAATHLQMARFSFDVFTGDWVRALCSGGRLVDCPRETLLDPAAMYSLMIRDGVDTAEFVPGVLRNLMFHLESTRQRLDFMRLVVVGSDHWHAGDHARLRALVGTETRIVNSYGLTEATIDSTYFEGDLSDAEPSRPVPIGRPFGSALAYILDRFLEPVPVGVPGELHIAGPGLARGYLNQPALTAERFIPCPFCAEPGSRLYRTGDLARWRPDGQIEILGRVDHQVKIRGFRVELGEVEAALGRHPAVREAAVVVREDSRGSGRLIAYVVRHPDSEADLLALRRWLQSQLPEYMVPAVFVELEDLPRLHNAKLDRSSLPTPDATERAPVAEYVAPRNPTEEVLCRIWAEVLGLDRVGIHDNFFDSGGHSLQTVQLVARVSEALNRHVSVKAVFQAPTVASMADALAAETLADQPATSLALHRPASRTARRLSPTSHVTIEDRPLLSLFASGKLAPVDAVALSYFPSGLLQYPGLTPEAVIRGWCGDMPVLGGVRETPLGRIGLVTIPRFDFQLYRDRQDLLDVTGDALRLARQIGSRVVSLTGLLPSATDYGRALAPLLSESGMPRITTGHATTTSAVVLSIRRALEDSGRSIGGEHVGFVGLGSVGVASLRLLLTCLPHPAELTLCDVYSKREELEALRREVVEGLGYRGPVHLLESRENVPASIAECTLIVGATNVPDILDLEVVRPGTVLVDDSAPHVFRSDAAFARMRAQADILATEGGVLAAPEDLPSLVHIPGSIDPELRAEFETLLLRSDPRQITGCVLSSLLSAQFDELSPTIGLIDRDTALKHFEALARLGYRAAALHLDDQPIDARTLRDFRLNHGDGDVPVADPEPAPATRPFEDTRLAAPTHPSLVAIQPRGTRPPLFLVHPIGGIALCYRELSKHLGEDQPLFALQAVGLDGEGTPDESVEAMAARYVEAVRTVKPEGPYRLGGWSLGGVIAYEMAAQLRERGDATEFLALIDSYVPNAGWGTSRLDDAELLAAFVLDLTRSLGAEVRIPVEPLRGLDEAHAWDAVLRQLRPYQPMFPHVRPEHLRPLWRVFRANSSAMRSYVPKAATAPVTLVRAGNYLDPTLGWGSLAIEGLATQVVPAEHHTILRGDAARLVADLLRAEIDRLGGGGEAVAP
jgi:amino acid adenylation domain-containing protein